MLGNLQNITGFRKDYNPGKGNSIKSSFKIVTAIRKPDYKDLQVFLLLI